MSMTLNMSAALRRLARVLLVVLALGLVTASPGVARGQGPAGNTHPDTQAISRIETGNPFGQAEPPKLSVDQKRAFADAVDVSPLRDLAVFHNGRVKILDTLARETVSSLMGRRDFMDFKIIVNDKGEQKADKHRYDPLFTMLDLAVDPGYYLDKPLIHVNYLPLRERYLDVLYPYPPGVADGDPAKQEHDWWKRLGRLKPQDLSRVGEQVESDLGFAQPMLRAQGELRSAFELYRESWRNYLMMAPASGETQWHHLSELPADSPAGKATRELGAAWRVGDAAGANAAIAKLAEELPKINAEYYPTTRRSLESAYNRANAFEWGYWLYAFSLLFLLLAFGTGRKWLAAAGVTTLFLAVGLHAFGFVARCIIAERFAIQNQFESMTGLSLFAAVVGLAIMLVRRQWLFGAAAAGVGFMVLITATQTGIPGVSVEREAAILNTSVLLKYHVTTVLVSYGLIALGFVISLFYLGTYYFTTGEPGRPATARGGAGGSASRPVRMPKGAVLAGVGAGAGGVAYAEAQAGEAALPVEVSASALGIEDEAKLVGSARVLADLDKSLMIVLQLAFWTLGVGILLGAWWADHSWGRWWAFDPKELWALVTWIVYLIVIHLRFALTGERRALTTAWLSVAGFIVMLWTYFGVNLLLPGLHAYA